jgi:hypothetical protein
MTFVARSKCANCENEADGLNEIHCQECWEKLCAESFWEFIDSLESEGAIANNVGQTTSS